MCRDMDLVRRILLKVGDSDLPLDAQVLVSDAIRNDTVWSRVKTRIARTVGSATIDTIKALAVRIATDMLMQ